MKPSRYEQWHKEWEQVGHMLQQPKLELDEINELLGKLTEELGDLEAVYYETHDR